MSQAQYIDSLPLEHDVRGLIAHGQAAAVISQKGILLDAQQLGS